MPCGISHIWEQINQDHGLQLSCFPLTCHHDGTFPAVHRLQHPLVIAIVWGHPLSAHAVRGEIPVPLLRRGHCPPFVSSQNNKKSIKYPWRFFPLMAISASLASICPSGPRLVPEYAVLWPQSTQRFTNLWFLFPSFLSNASLPHWVRLCPSPFFFLFSFSSFLLFLSLTFFLS